MKKLKHRHVMCSLPKASPLVSFMHVSTGQAPDRVRQGRPGGIRTEPQLLRDLQTLRFPGTINSGGEVSICRSLNLSGWNGAGDKGVIGLLFSTR